MSILPTTNHTAPVFKANTLFVLGAGASCEARMPSGGELKPAIARALNLTYDFSAHPKTGDARIAYFMQEYVRDRPERDAFNRLLSKAWAVRDGMPLSISIDNYLDAHRGDKDLEYVAKLAIAATILDAESSSIMRPSSEGEDAFSFTETASTWYVKFAQLLAENATRDQIGEALDRVSVITFNYDRTLEHFLRQALSVYYQLDIREAESFVNRMKILHPYGKIGALPWQEPRRSVQFGRPRSAILGEIAGQIRTFGERIEDEEALNAIRQTIAKAHLIVFLGFGFHRQNMALLTPEPAPGASARVIATGYGISKSDRQEIEVDLNKMFYKARTETTSQRFPDIIWYDDTCTNCMDEFRRTMTG